MQAQESAASSKESLDDESSPALRAEEVLMYHRATSRLLELCYRVV
jgi:hypothetical protein